MRGLCWLQELFQRHVTVFGSASHQIGRRRLLRLQNKRFARSFFVVARGANRAPHSILALDEN
jgi:hypothetical protein